MKKNILFIIVFLFILVLIKYYCSPYEITYKLNKINIIEKYENKKKTLIIEDNELSYVIELYNTNSISKKIIKDIEIIKEDEYICYKTTIKGDKENLNCFKNGNSISYSIIENEEIKKIAQSMNLKIFEEIEEKENFKFYSNLNDNIHLAIWNYNGFYLINDNEITENKMFQSAKYDNSLCYSFDNYLLIPNYDEEYEFTTFNKLNILNGDVKKIQSKSPIDYDMYISNKHKNNLYLFDKKYSKLYEINMKKDKIEEIGNKNKGYIKLENGKKIKASINDYNNGKKLDNEKITKYEISDALYRVYDNEHKTKIFNSTEVQLVKEYNNDLYFIYKDNLYIYNDMNGIEKILHYFELNFNFKNMIYIYIGN